MMADVYDDIINDDIDYEDYKNFIINECNKNKISFNNYLDIACGTGNITVLLGSFFKSIWAVDLSNEMLSIAKNKLQRFASRAKIIRENMINLNLNKKFDLITCMLDAVNYIVQPEDLNAFFINVKNHLSDEGIFIFDMDSFYKLKNVLGNNIFTYDEKGIFYTWENEFEINVLHMYLTFFVKEGSLYRRFDEEHVERAYSLDEIKSYIKSSGLEIIKISDNYSKNEINKKTERIVFTIKKRGI